MPVQLAGLRGVLLLLKPNTVTGIMLHRVLLAALTRRPVAVVLRRIQILLTIFTYYDVLLISNALFVCVI